MYLKAIADKLTTELTGALNYVVTDNLQWFNENMKLDGADYVPTVIRIINDFADENKYIRTTTYEMKFHVLKEDIDDYISDMKDFRDSQLDETIGTDYVTKTYYLEQYDSETTLTNVDYDVYIMQFTWSYSLSVVGSQAIIKVDTVAIPFLSCNVVHDIAYVSNQDSASNYRMTNDVVTLDIPLILSNAKVLELYGAINSNTYNKEYALDIDGATKTVVLKQSNFTLERNGGLTSMILVMETAYPRVSITLDSVELPITAYQYQGKVTTTDGKKNSLDAILRTHGVSKVRSWSITFVKDGSVIYDKIVDDAYGNSLDTTYTLVRDGVTYTLMLADAIERYTETGDMMIECQFIDYGDA